MFTLRKTSFVQGLVPDALHARVSPRGRSNRGVAWRLGRAIGMRGRWLYEHATLRARALSGALRPRPATRRVGAFYTMSDKTHILRVGDNAYHLRSGRWGVVQHVSVRRNVVLLRHADGEERSYPVDALRVRNAVDGEPTVRCQVEVSK